MSPYLATARRYAEQVIAGDIVACKWARLACERFQRDLAAQEDPAWPYALDESEKGDAHRVCTFTEKLPHVKGDWARRDAAGRLQRIRLEPWQVFVLVNIFGWKKRSDGKRRFVEATVYVPRKNGKSMLAAAVGWWMFAKDGEPGAEVYSGATTEKQAMEVFRPAKMMTSKLPALKEQLGVTVRAKSMTREDGSKFEPIVGVPVDGSSPHCAIIDEYHEHKSTGLRDAMRTGQGARRQPLLFTISTAGFNLEGPCAAHWLDCQQLLNGTHIDNQHFVIIFSADDPENWASEVEIRKANPNLGASLYLEKLLRDVENAKRDPIAQTTVKTKVLNLWVRSKVSLFNVELWLKLTRPGLKREQFAGVPFVCGMDLAYRSDLASLATIYQREGKFYVFGDHYHHAEFVHESENGHYARWARDGWLHVNPGNVIDLTIIYQRLYELHETGFLSMLVYDPAHAQTVVPPLKEYGVNCLDMTGYAQTTGKMPEWIVDFDAAYRSGMIVHDGNPLTAWALGNCVGKPTRSGLVYLEKANASLKIDPATALIMAFGFAKNMPPPPEPSIRFM